MSLPKDHHYVPQFLLAGWGRAGDGKLTVYSRKGNRIVTDWKPPKTTAYEPNLYSLPAVPIDQSQWVEIEIMTKEVDTPASLVLRKMLDGKTPGSFTLSDRNTWTRFILAQWWRSPHSIEKLYKAGLAELDRQFALDADAYQRIKGSSPYPTLRHWVDANVADFEDLSRLVTVGQTLPQLIADPKAGGIIINMHWRVLDLRNSKIDLVLSDHPVVRTKALDAPDCIIAVPLDPTRLFIATDRLWLLNLEKIPAIQIARGMNQYSAQSAAERIFSTGTQHVKLAEKYLPGN